MSHIEAFFSSILKKLLPEQMVWGVTRRDGGGLGAADKLTEATALRRVEMKNLLQVRFAMEKIVLVLPSSKDISKWRRDQKLKDALEKALHKECGLKRTVNPLNLSPSLD